MSVFTKNEIEVIKQMPTLGYWSMLGGVELKYVEYGIEDYAVVVVGASYNQNLSKVHRLRINHYNHKRNEDRSPEYINCMGTMLWFDDCIRC